MDVLGGMCCVHLKNPPPESSGCVWDLFLTGLDTVCLYFPEIPWISDSSWLDLKFLLGPGFVEGWGMGRDLL